MFPEGSYREHSGNRANFPRERSKNVPCLCSPYLLGTFLCLLDADLGVKNAPYTADLGMKNAADLGVKNASYTADLGVKNAHYTATYVS